MSLKRAKREPCCMTTQTASRKYRRGSPETTFMLFVPDKNAFPRCVGNTKGPNRRPCGPPEGTSVQIRLPLIIDPPLGCSPDIFMYFIGNERHFCPLQALRMEVGPAAVTASSSHSNTAAVAAASLWTITRQMLIGEISKRERGMI